MQRLDTLVVGLVSGSLSVAPLLSIPTVSIIFTTISLSSQDVISSVEYTMEACCRLLHTLYLSTRSHTDYFRGTNRFVLTT
ncbi:hypothetical protein DFJ58DRAFT_760966, partial [Suillus subalutaceus]|uniref:uncharacterized protein n=1 Tax=Suillus subalutaceus TaxID=48586 RepID=UPI001B87D7E7